jgi:hypothetical protein
LPTPSITGAANVCSGNTVTLNAGSYSSYSWSPGGGSGSMQAVTATGAYSYTVTVTDGNGCQNTASASGTIYALPTPSITGAANVCSGNTVTLNAGSYSSYSWSPGGGSGSTQAVTATGPYSYSVTVTDIHGCQSATSASGTIYALPTPSITGAANVCSGNTVTLNAGSYSSYSWSPGGGSGSTQAVTATGAYSYSVTVTDIHGCQSATSASGTIYALPTPTITGAANVCSGNTVTLNAGSYSSYSWSPGSGSGSTQAVTATGAYSYTVTVTDIHGCQSATSASGTIYALPTPTISGSPFTVCYGNTVTLNAGSWSTYSWNNGGGTNETVSVSSVGTTTYSVTVTNANGCASATSQSVTINTLPVAAASVTTPIACNGGNGIITVTATGGTSPYSGTGANSKPYGTYSFTVTDHNGCTSTVSQAITQPTQVTFTTVVTNVSGCGTSTTTGSIAVTASGGTGTKTYSRNNGSTYQGASLFSGLPVGSDTVKVKDANGCLSTASNIVIIRTGGVTFRTTIVNATTCTAANGKITVNASGGSGFYNYAKDGGTVYLSSAIFTSLLHGTYSIRVKDASGCLSNDSVVTVGPTSGAGCRTMFEGNSVQSGSNTFNIYPNPASDQVTILFTADKVESNTINLMDISGRIVFTTSIESVIGDNQFQLNLYDFAKGMYMVIIKNDDGMMQKRIIIQ